MSCLPRDSALRESGARDSALREWDLGRNPEDHQHLRPGQKSGRKSRRDSVGNTGVRLSEESVVVGGEERAGAPRRPGTTMGLHSEPGKYL